MDIADGTPTRVTRRDPADNIGPVTEWLALFQVTGDPKWHVPFKMGLDGGGYRGTSAKYGRMPHALVRWPEPYRGMLREKLSGRKAGYAGFYLSKDRSQLEQWLADSASWYGRYRHMHTAAEQKTDRVLTYRASTPVACYLGDAPNRNRFLNFSAVSYEGLANLEAICAVDEIDMVTVGPADWSIGLGLHGPGKAAVMGEKCDAVLTKALSAGKIAAMTTSDGNQGRDYMRKGVRILFASVDIGFRGIRGFL